MKHLEGSIKGKVAKLIKEVSLVDQKYVKDGSKTVAQYAKDEGIELVEMFRYVVGEGIEVAKTDFAAEVAAQMAGNK